MCDAAQMLESLGYNVPKYNVRNNPLFYINVYNSNYLQNAPFNSMLLLYFC